MKIKVHNYVEKTITKCPHCGHISFEPLRFSSDVYAMSIFDVKTRPELVEGNISLGGPGFVVYYKRCLNCGFVAPFDAKIVEEHGKL